MNQHVEAQLVRECGLELNPAESALGEAASGVMSALAGLSYYEAEKALQLAQRVIKTAATLPR